MPSLPDPCRSRAVLIGTRSYKHLDDLPAVGNNLTELRAVLIDPTLGGLPADKCTILKEPPSALAVYTTLREHAVAAEDTLLVYFAGHGWTGARNELYLCLPDTNPDLLSFTALGYEQLREAVADSRATKKVVILDCCFSGRALADLTGDEETVVGQIGIEGTYILTATPRNAVALAPSGARYTAFTGVLLELLRTGIPGGPELLTFAAIFPALKHTLTSRRFPAPRQQGSDTIAHLSLVRNAAYRARPETHLDLDGEVASLLEWKAATEAIVQRLQAEVTERAAEVERLQAEVTERAAEVERLRGQMPRTGPTATGQQFCAELREAQTRLEDAATAQATAQEKSHQAAAKLKRIKALPGEEIRLQKVAKFWNQQNKWDRPDGLFIVTSHRLVFLSKLKSITVTTDFLSFPLEAVDNVSQKRIMHISPAVSFNVSGEPYVFTFFRDVASVIEAISQALRQFNNGTVIDSQ